ncbi:MAG: OmpA family protein, partial [Prevotellaceae bacterium]|nr:OmpA family protein [Prevotellaceae bacterium]
MTKIQWFCALCLLVAVCSCSNENIAFKKAEQAYALGEYYTASVYFKKSYAHCKPKDKAKRGVRSWWMGECYRRINYTQKAVAAYQNAVRYKCPDSLAVLRLAQQQLKLGAYKQAEQNFRAYLELDPTNELAHMGLLSCELAPQWKAEPNLYKVKREAVFNSRRSDFSPMLVPEGTFSSRDDVNQAASAAAEQKAVRSIKEEFNISQFESSQLVLTSTRNDATGDDYSGITGVKFADLFLARREENGKWKQPEVVESEVNTDYDEGACCFSPDGKTMYFTRCSSDPDYPRNAEIWQSLRSDASWSKPTKCDISKDTLSSFAHPAVSPDGEWLYFVSDMPGGLGGMDIWRTRILSSGFGGVENLGRPINTPGDEVFPTFRPNGDLYFSSDGHPGMGGLDILKATPDSLRGWIVENQQFPLNSSADDFGMTFDGVHNRGLFCSSRNDNKGWENIYSFELPEVLQTVTGWVYEKDGYELPEGLVYMVGNDGTNEKLSVRSDGSFTKVIKPGVDYVFLGTCKGYLNVKQALRVSQSEESEDYVLQFALPPINIPVLIDNIFYEFDKATLTPESTEALDRLVTMMEENPNITIELSSHCDYRGNDAYNERLAQRRAESVVNYMIAHGVKRDRLTPVGYGESRPKVVRRRLAAQHEFLNEGDTLTEAFIKKLNEEQQEICNAINRRTEFRV